LLLLRLLQGVGTTWSLLHVLLLLGILLLLLALLLLHLHLTLLIWCHLLALLLLLLIHLLVLILLLVLLLRILPLRVLFPHNLVLTDVFSQCTVVVLSGSNIRVSRQHFN